MAKKCSVEGCDRDATARGFCNRHYMGFRRTGNPLGKTRRVERGVSGKHPLYSTWAGMRQRCYNPECDSFPNYGARGIEVCEEWLLDFWQFVDDMDPKPSREHSIDRRDNDGPYSKENCRWATHVEQGANRRTTQLQPEDRERAMQLVTETNLSVRQIAKQIGKRSESVRKFLNGETFVRPSKVPEPLPIVTPEMVAFTPEMRHDGCAMDGCAREHYGKGFCRKHYRWKFEGQTVNELAELPAERHCLQCGTVIPEDRRVTAKWCKLNCKEAWHRAHPNRLTDQPKCSTEGCGRPARCKGMCQGHYMRSYHAERPRNPEDGRRKLDG